MRGVFMVCEWMMERNWELIERCQGRTCRVDEPLGE